MVAMNYAHVGTADPSRIASGVVTGIGFLGAGAIIRYGSSIRGLTTAASIWAVAAIGLAVGGGMYEAAGITTAVALATLILSRVEEIVELKRSGKKLVVFFYKNSSVGKKEIDTVIEMLGGRIKHVAIDENDKGTKLVYDLILSRIYHQEIIAEIASLVGVKSVKWE